MFGTKETGYEGGQGDDGARASVGLVIPGHMRLTDTETVGDQEKEKKMEVTMRAGRGYPSFNTDGPKVL